MVSIRKATIEDLNSIQQLNHAVMVNNPKYDKYLIADFDLNETGKEFFKEALESPEGLFFIAQDEGRMVGYINGNPKNAVYRTGKVFEIENLGVIPEYKGKGIGFALYSYLIEEIKKLGFERVFLNCFIKNTEAISFYKKVGFEEIDVSFEKEI